MQNTTKDKNFISGYSEVNGLNMYYEMYGVGKPIILIHGGGSTIQTSFAKLIPLLAQHRKVIAVELQAHGRTGDRDTDLSFTQDADDVATLLENLGIGRADFLGFSNGGQTTLEIVLRHPDLVNKIIICSAFYKRSAASAQFWDGFQSAQFSDMPQPYKNEFLKVNNDAVALLNMFNKDVKRMRYFKDWTDKQIQSIKAPALVVNGNQDVGSPEHAVEMFRTIPNCQLAILPGGHGTYMGEITASKHDTTNENHFVLLLECFLGNG